MVGEKMVRTKWYGQNGIRTKWYRTKWHGQNGIRTKWYRTKWYGQNSTDKMVRIKYYRVINQSSSRRSYNFFHQPHFHFDAFSFPLCAYNLFVTFVYQNIY